MIILIKYLKSKTLSSFYQHRRKLSVIVIKNLSYSSMSIKSSQLFRKTTIAIILSYIRTFKTFIISEKFHKNCFHSYNVFFSNNLTLSVNKTSVLCN